MRVDSRDREKVGGAGPGEQGPDHAGLWEPLNNVRVDLARETEMKPRGLTVLYQALMTWIPVTPPTSPLPILL